MINKKRLITLCQRLISIDSQNPPGDEADIALYVKGYLNKLGVKAQSHAFKKRRVNIVAVIKGRNPRRSLLITPHLDTVCQGKGWRFPPLAGKLEGKKIYGLGATDCKCNLAVSLEVINSLAQQRYILDYNLVFAATADEESGSAWGLIPLLHKKILRAHAALVLDADAFSIIVAQKGLIHLKVKLKGLRAHGAYPWLGKNAISLAARIIRDLEAQAFSYQKNRFLRPPTVNTGTIRGGDKVNVVADWCEVEFDFRFLPKTSAPEVLAALKAVIRRHTRRFSIEIEGIQEPYEIDPRHPLVAHLAQAMRSFKIAPRISGSEGATTITFFQHQGIPAVATGFGVKGCAHAINEYVSVDNLYKGALVLEEFLKKYKF